MRFVYSAIPTVVRGQGDCRRPQLVMTLLLTQLPEDCLRAVLRSLCLRDILRVSSVCKSLRNVVLRAFPILTCVVSVSHSEITDAQLRAICRKARGAVRALSIAGCEKLTISGVVDALRLCPRLQYLDLSACHPALVNDRAMHRFAPYITNLKVLRLAHAPQVTSVAFDWMRGRGFGQQLVALDVSFSWMVPRAAVEQFCNLSYVVAPGTKLLPSATLSSARRGVVYKANGADTLILAHDVWEAVATDDCDALSFLVHAVTSQLVQPSNDPFVDREHKIWLASIRNAYIEACTWNRHAERAVRCKHADRANAPQVQQLRTSLLAYSAHAQASRVAAILVRECNADPLAFREQCPLSIAMLSKASSKDREKLLAALTPRPGLSLVQPVAVALVVLAASRKDVVALSSILRLNTGAEAKHRTALARALFSVFDPPSRIPFPTPENSGDVFDDNVHFSPPTTSSWLSMTMLSGRSRSSCHVPVDPLATGSGTSDEVACTGEVVRVLLERGAPIHRDIVVKATMQGEHSALRHLLLFDAYRGDLNSTTQGFIPSVDAVDTAKPHVLDALFERLKWSTTKRETLLAVAAAGENCRLAQTTVSFLLEVMAVLERRRSAGGNSKNYVMGKSRYCAFRGGKKVAGSCRYAAFDEDAAKAIGSALSAGNDTVARVLVEARPLALKLLVSRRELATLSLHAVARRVGRGGAADHDLMLVGRHILSAGDMCNAGRVSDWLSTTLLDSVGRTALHYAAGASDPTFARCLLRMGAAVNTVDSDGATALCTAVEWHASRACLETLLAAGANVHMTDRRGRGALHRAAEARNGAAAAVLLRFGADPMAADDFGVAPVHIDMDLLHRASIFAVAPMEGTPPFGRLRLSNKGAPVAHDNALVGRCLAHGRAQEYDSDYMDSQAYYVSEADDDDQCSLGS